MGHLGSIARLLSAFSTRPGIVSCSGCPTTILQTLDASPYFEKGTQYPFRFDGHTFNVLVRRADTKVFGPIDFLSVLHFLIVYLGGAQHQSWLPEATHLMQVIILWFPFRLCYFPYFNLLTYRQSQLASLS